VSVVSCRVYDDRVEVASDSGLWRGWSQRKGDHHDFVKLTKVGDVVIGSVGSAELIGLLQMFAETHVIAAADKSGVLNWLGEFQDWIYKKTGSWDKNACDFIIVVGGRAFMAAHTWSIHEITGYVAIGAGADYAEAAMYMGASPERAVECAAELCAYVELPVIKYTVKKNAKN